MTCTALHCKNITPLMHSHTVLDCWTAYRIASHHHITFSDTEFQQQISPLLSPFGMLFYAFAYLMYKYQVRHPAHSNALTLPPSLSVLVSFPFFLSSRLLLPFPFTPLASHWMPVISPKDNRTILSYLEKHTL